MHLYRENPRAKRCRRRTREVPMQPILMLFIGLAKIKNTCNISLFGFLLFAVFIFCFNYQQISNYCN